MPSWSANNCWSKSVMRANPGANWSLSASTFKASKLLSHPHSRFNTLTCVLVVCHVVGRAGNVRTN